MGLEIAGGGDGGLCGLRHVYEGLPGSIQVHQHQELDAMEGKRGLSDLSNQVFAEI